MAGHTGTFTDSTDQNTIQHDTIEFIVGMARALCQQGTPAHRLEHAMAVCAGRLGVHAEFFATPTAVFLSLGEGATNITRLVRVESAGLDLDRLARIDGILQRVSAGEITPADGRCQLAEAQSSPPAWPAWVSALAFALAAATAGRFFGGGWREVLASALAGLTVGLFALISGRVRRLVRVFEFASGVVVAVLAVLAAASPLHADTETVVVSGLIVLVPGLSLTMAVSEIASRNIVSGAARLMGAATTFATIAFGVAAGTGVLKAFVTPVPVDPVALAPATLWIALVLAPVALTVLFNADVRDLPAIAVTAVLGFLTARAVGDAVGTTLGVGAGAVVVGLASNARAIRANRPVAVCAIPGIMLLVPGAIGFRSLAAFLDQQALHGLEAAVLAITVALALATGLLLANVLLPPQREI